MMHRLWPDRAFTGLSLLTLLTAVLLSFSTGCLPTYDSEEATFQGSSNGGSTSTGGDGQTTVTCEAPAQEVCDGTDNDCDGQVDEDFPRRGIPCGNNIGVCASVVICEDGAEQCIAAQEPTEEICDGLDNDCDGLTDELTQEDPNNCGVCGNVCAFDGGMAGCMDGECVLVACNAGFEDCDGSLDNGCETNTVSDLLNCGGCGQICSNDTADTVCQSGMCSIQQCRGDRMDCNNFPLDGCEADLDVDIFNCGGCGIQCAFPNAQATCLDQMCAFESCLPGFIDRDANGDNGCEFGLRVVGSPPDAALGNLVATTGRLYGSAGNRLFGYTLLPDGSIGGLLFTYTALSSISGLDAEGNVVFAALDAGDVQIIDTTNPDDINVLGLAVTTGPAPGFARQAPYLYIADGRDGLKVVDITSPSSPRQVGRAQASNLVDKAFVFDNRALLSSSTRAELEMYDISNPASPEWMGTFPTDAPFDQALLSGDLLITGLSGSATISLHRLSDDGTTFLGRTNLPGGVASLSQRAPFLVAITESRSATVNLLLLDISRPQRPNTVTTFDTGVSNRPRSAAFTENQVYIAGERGLQRFDISDLRSPLSAQDLVRPQQLRDLVVSGSRMYVASDGAVEVLDISTPANPSRIARFGDNIFQLALTDDSLFITSNTLPIARYTITTLSDEPTPVSVYNGPRPTNAIAASRDSRYVYALSGTSFTVIEMLTGGQEPVVRGSLTFESTCRDMLRDPRDGNYLYLACNGGLVVLNVTIPANPQQITQVPGGGLFAVHLFGQTLYGLTDNGISVYRATQPGDILSRGMVTFEGLSSLRHLTGQGTWMVAASGSTVTLLDRSAELLEMPQRIVDLALDGSVVSLGADTNGFIYAGTSQGVFRLDVQEP